MMTDQDRTLYRFCKEECAFLSIEYRLIETEKDHQAALVRLDEIFDAEPGTIDGHEAELLTRMIETYERQKYPIDEAENDRS